MESPSRLKSRNLEHQFADGLKTDPFKTELNQSFPGKVEPERSTSDLPRR